MKPRLVQIFVIVASTPVRILWAKVGKGSGGSVFRPWSVVFEVRPNGLRYGAPLRALGPKKKPVKIPCTRTSASGNAQAQATTVGLVGLEVRFLVRVWPVRLNAFRARKRWFTRNGSDTLSDRPALNTPREKSLARVCARRNVLNPQQVPKFNRLWPRRQSKLGKSEKSTRTFARSVGSVGVGARSEREGARVVGLVQQCVGPAARALDCPWVGTRTHRN